MDGKTVKMLVLKGSQQQFEACGLITVSEQLQFRTLIEEKLLGCAPVTQAQFRGGKPTKKRLKCLSETDQKVYKVKRNKVKTDAIRCFPGNDIPNFKTCKEAPKKLEELTNSSVEECTHEAAGFYKLGIKQHILDVLNERRRNHRRGRDYDMVNL
ncbi:hypothetical protein AC249_AIPGENE16605 [Exaiptasia diaphana]|nr:hypothetical protein AC249_AIPGENE16605 [Exaiptasia diaphana]